MEISFDTIISILSLCLGGGGGAFFTWKYVRKKAQAEANEADAEAKRAEASAAKEMQDMYQQLIEDVKADRKDQRDYIEELKNDRKHLREDRNDLRKRIETNEEDLRLLKREVARYGRQVSMMRPMLCAKMNCQNREQVVLSDTEDVNEEKEIKTQ